MRVGVLDDHSGVGDAVAAAAAAALVVVLLLLRRAQPPSGELRGVDVGPSTTSPANPSPG